MTEVINLRRARKAKARAEKARQAEANRASHGVTKPARDLARARTEKDSHAVEQHRLDEE